MAASDKGISLKKEFLKKFYLTSRIKYNHWKELTKLVQNYLGTILIGWIVAEIFDLEIRQNCWQGRISIFLTSFCEIQYAITQGGSSRSTCFMGHFESVFRALSAVGFILWISKTTKTCFWIILTLWSNPYMHNSCLGISPKYLIFRNAPKLIIDLCGISFLCADFETFTIFSAIVLKSCTYPPYYGEKTGRVLVPLPPWTE